MKLLLTTIRSDRPQSGLEMKYLYSVIADSPMDVHISCYEKNDKYDEIFEEIASGRFNIVYFHADCFNEWQLRHIAEMVKKAVPGIAIIFGGPEVSFETRGFMKENPFVDYVIRGEGEKVIFNFVKTLLEVDFDFENIAGLAYRDGDQVVVNPYDSPVEIEDLPFPYEKFDPGEGPVYYETIRGTSDRSVYSQHLPEPRVRYLSLGRVCTELRYFLAAGVRRIVFLDRWFNYNTERAYRILEYIINNDNGITDFEFSIDGHLIDDETIRLLADARKGQITFNIDVASINPEVLVTVGKSENVYRLMYNTTKLLQNGNVYTRMHVTAGLPLETEEMFARTFNKVFSMADGMPVKINFLCMSKGTALREESKQFGYVYSSAAPYEVICNGYLSADELLKIKRISKIVEIFTAGGIFRNSFKRIMTDTGIRPYVFFAGLTKFVSEHDLLRSTGETENIARIIFTYAGEIYDVYIERAKLEMMRNVIYSDLSALVSEDALVEFGNRGWDILPRRVDVFTEPDAEEQEAQSEEGQTEEPEEAAAEDVTENVQESEAEEKTGEEQMPEEAGEEQMPEEDSDDQTPEEAEDSDQDTEADEDDESAEDAEPEVFEEDDQDEEPEDTDEDDQYREPWISEEDVTDQVPEESEEDVQEKEPEKAEDDPSELEVILEEDDEEPRLEDIPAEPEPVDDDDEEDLFAETDD